MGLLTWANPSISGIVLTSGLALMISLCSYSLISVTSNLMLLLTLGGLSCKMYVHFMGLLKKPCKDPLVTLEGLDLSVKEEGVLKVTEALGKYYNQAAEELKRLLLLDNIFDSLKFGLLMYLLTVVGGMMSFLTLIILCWVLAFILPTAYLKKRKQLDTYLDKVKQAWGDANNKVYSLMKTNEQKIETVEKKE